MKLLFDQNLSFKLCGQLTDLFPNSGQARLLGLAEADDRALWQFAGANGYVLVTFDADFAELAALRGPPPKVIWTTVRQSGDRDCGAPAARTPRNDRRIRTRPGGVPGDLSVAQVILGITRHAASSRMIARASAWAGVKNVPSPDSDSWSSEPGAHPLWRAAESLR